MRSRTSLLAAAALSCTMLAPASAFGEPTPAATGSAPLVNEFKRADSNADGKLSEDEARKAGFFSEESFSETDENRDGTITLFELGASVQARFQSWIDRHTKADSDSDGSVSRDEAGDSWNDYYARADRDNDGQISRAELMDRVTRGYYSETTTEPTYPNIIDKRF